MTLSLARKSNRRESVLRGRRARLFLEPLEDRRMLSGVPEVGLNIPSEELIGEDFSFTATFDNVAANPTDLGYGPFVDLIFPVNGADGAAGTDTPDGISFLNATYLGLPVVATVLTFPDDGGGMGSVEHPYAVDNLGQPLTVTGITGDQLVVLQLPFGSFTPDQPPVAITVNASLSNLADLGVPLTIRTRGGFQFGCDPLNNPATDPSILTPGSTSSDSLTWVESGQTTPELIHLTKTYLGPEDETATGPNFPRQYQITVDIANGQTVTDLDIVDALDNTMAFLSVDSTTSVTPATVFTFPGGLPPVGVPANSNELWVNASTVTGGIGDTDVQVVFSFYIPEFDADGARVIPINGQDPTLTTDTATAVGDWIPLDPRDPATPDNAVAGPETHILQNKSIAIQKSFQVVGGGDVSPGTNVEFTLSFQISDYYTFGDLLLEDTFSDGLDWLPAFVPTFQVTDQDGNVSGTFTLGTNLTHTVNVDGTETLDFDLSAAMVGAGAPDGILRGGLATATDGDDSSPAAAATGTIVFRTVISQDFDQLPPSGQSPIAQGDTLTNDVDISGTVRDNDNIGTIIGPAPDGREGDDSSASGTIPVGTLSKSIYAINGVTGVGTNPLIAPGDSITYSLEYTNPISTFVNFQMLDFLPLPVFQILDPDADGTPGPAWSFVLDGNPNNAPLPGVIELGPNDTFFAISGTSAGPTFFSPPTISINSLSNELELFYGDYDDSLNRTTTINLLFTVTASDDPFADGLLLTNQVRAIEDNSQLVANIEDSIVQIQLGEPVLNITKGVLATDNPVGVFDPTPPVAAPLSVSAPGTAGFRLSGGTLNSDFLDATPLDSNLAGIDAGDLVTFSIVVENTGSSRRGAFDIELRDTLPAGFRIPTLAESAAQLNLSVTDGTGAAISFNNLGSGLFDPAGGIELVDPGPTAEQPDGTAGGALDAYNATSGRNVMILTYDLVADVAANPREVLINTATLFNYAGAPGGPDFTTENPFDTAEVTVASPTVDKTISATNQPHTTGNNVAIGEIVTYQVEISIPEGTTSSVTMVDSLDTGLAFVGINSIVASPGVTTTIPGGFPAVAANVTVLGIGAAPQNQGRLISLGFGDVVNADTDNGTSETITILYDVVVINSNGNNRGTNRNNLASWVWNTASGLEQTNDSAPNVQIVEPTLQIAKSGTPSVAQAGDVVTYTIDISHTAASNSDAFDVDLSDVIPSDLIYVPGSLMSTGALAPTTLSESGGTVTATWNTFPDGATAELQFDVIINTTVVAGEVITNTAGITWTSLPGDVTTPQSIYNTLSTERTGDPADPGGSVNDYIDSAPASITIRNPEILGKVLVSTSEPSTTGANVAIGEIVRYRLESTIIAGTTVNLQFIDTLPAGLQLIDPDQVKISFISDLPIVSAPDLAGANNGANPPTFVMPAGRVSGTQTVVFNFGTLINQDIDAGDELIVLEFNALVTNTAQTNDGDIKTNTFDLVVDGSLVDTSPGVDVTIREPRIDDVDKSTFGMTPEDAGDSVDYLVTYSNTGSTTAFDVRLLDMLDPTYLTLTLPPQVFVSGGVAGVNDNSVGNTVDISIDSIPVGGSVVVGYSAITTYAVQPGQTIPNTANVTYTSLPGTGTPTTSPANNTGSQTPGGSGAANGERNGSGGVNDYRDSSNAEFQINQPQFSKSIVATNQPSTSGLDVAIGEIVTYQSVITIPEGTSPNSIVVDAPDAGLAIVAIDSIVPSSSSITTSQLGGFAQVRILANASIPVDGSSYTANFGTLFNNESDPGSETITITYRAVVLNTVANSQGFMLDNDSTYTWSQGAISDQASPVTIVEPQLEVIKSNGSPLLGDAGDTITFMLNVQHTPGSDADAFDVNLSDLINSLPNGMTYVPGSVMVLVNSGGATLAGPPTDAGGDLSIDWSLFPLGAMSTVSFQVTLDITVGPEQLLTNHADVTWTSLPGDVTTPQSSNPYSVERTGDPAGPGEPGANTYIESDNGLVGTPSLDFSKEVVDSSLLSTQFQQFDPALPDYTIGELVTYALIVDFLDGTTDNVVLTDNLPQLASTAGTLQFVSAQLAFVGSDLTNGMGGPIVLPVPTASDTNGDGIDDQFSFDFGTIINAIDPGINPEAEDQLVVAITARVLNTLPDMSQVNFSGDVLTNSATLTATGGMGPIMLTDSADIEIVEPDLVIMKDASPLLVDGGDTVTFTMTVDHTAASTSNAYDVSISDVLPAGMTYVGNITVLSGAGPAVTVAGPTLTFSWPVIALTAPSYQFTFEVTIDPTVVPGQTFLNVADLGWSTLPGTDPGERTYTDSDPADIISTTTTAQNPVKSLVATSEASTLGSDVAVGEIVRYQLQFEITEGTLPNLRMIDTLGPGLQFIDPSQVFVSFTSDVPMGAAADLLGANNGAMPPTHLLSPGRITTMGQQVIFDLGTITNNDNDPNAEFITLQYNVLVNNTTDTNDGDVLNNSFTVDLNGTPIGPANPGDNTVSVTVLEPTINDVEKSVLTFDGDSVTYQVTFSSSGSTVAFDARVLDVLPPQLSLDVSSVSVTLLGGASGANTGNSTATTVDVRVDRMPVGSQAVVTYRALLNVAGQTIPNTADVSYTSLPGTNGTANNPTGSQTPGVPGAANGERDGSGGVNDFVDSDSQLLGSLGDFVWDDLNGNGAQDPGEPGLDGVAMTLVWPGPNGILGDGDDVTLTTLTSGGGMYTFSGLPASNYQVAVDVNTLPAGYVNTYDLDGNRNSQTEVSLTAGQNRTDVDFGYAVEAAAGGVKWNDINANGVQDSGEGPLAGVTIYADLNNDNVFGPGDPSAVTGPTGDYVLSGLTPGTVTIREVPPSGYYQTYPANFAGHTVTLAPGETLADLNFGNAQVQPIVINDSDDGFTIVTGGDWIYYPDCVGHWENDATVSIPGMGENAAMWQFTSLDPGYYRVSATWVANPLGATNTPFTISGGPTTDTVRVDQMVSPATYPDSFYYGGVPWMDLDSSYQITGNTLTVTITNDANGVVVADAIRIERIVNPEIVVTEGSTEISDGGTTIDYGATGVGTPVTLTYTVENQGGSDLYLAEPIEVPGGYTVVNSFGQTTLAPGQTTTFDVRLDAQQSGVFAGNIVFYNSDNDENPFTFAVSGSVDADVVDDGDPDFSTVGLWTRSVGAGYQNDVVFSAAGSGNSVATWNFTGLTPATTYQVAATWTTNPNRATNAPYTIIGGVSPLSTTVNQQLPPDDFLEGTTDWEVLGSVMVTGGTLQVQLTNAANGFVVADAVRLVPLSTPDVSVAVGGVPLQDGASTVDFGPALLNLPIQKTFTVTNDGFQTLTLVEPIAAPGGFLVSSFGQTVLNPGQSTTFTVTLTATIPGNYSGQVSFGSNDPDENPFNFTVQGQVYVTPPPQIIDNGDSGFSTVGIWVPFTGSGYENDGSYATAGTGSRTATWSFPLPAPGTYRVSVTWPAHPNRATNAPYSVNGGPPTLVNQQMVPNDFIEAGTPWEDLGNFVIAGTTLDVTLSNAANGYVIADAVRIERIASPEIRVTVDGHVVADGTGLLELGDVLQGEVVSRQVRVTNIGTEYLVLDTISASGGFQASPFGQFTLAPEASTTFTISLDTSSAGSLAGQISFINNDPDEGTFNFAVTAEVTAAPQVFVLDNGDAGFQITGNWANYVSAGFQQDLLYSAAGLGNDTARWTFDGLVPGGYRVSTTWTPHSNRGSNVPYSVNGSAAMLVDQRISPSGLSDQGAVWQVLGDFLTDGDRLVVTMTDAANGYVIADAIRVERIQDAEIVVREGGSSLQNGLASLAFGSTPIGAPISKTFTVVNVGAMPLSLSGPIQLPPGFSSSGFSVSQLEAGESTTFTLTLTAAASGAYSGQVSFVNGDADEGLFNFDVSGLVATAVPPQIIDDGAVGFSQTSGWTRYSGVGRESDVHYAAAGSGSAVATWTFTVPSAGDYVVSATWVPHPNRATDAPYRIYDGAAGPASLLTTQRVNQKLTPAASFLDAGTSFQNLSVVSISGNTLTVTLANDANQYVIADAVRIEFVQPLRAAETDLVLVDGDAPTLTENRVREVLPAAIARWEQSGLSADQQRLLRDVAVEVMDLPGRMLGGATSAGLLIDVNAAGYDLLEVLTHELGHVLGLPDLPYDPLASERPVMAGELPKGGLSSVGLLSGPAWSPLAQSASDVVLTDALILERAFATGDVFSSLLPSNSQWRRPVGQRGSADENIYTADRPLELAARLVWLESRRSGRRAGWDASEFDARRGVGTKEQEESPAEQFELTDLALRAWLEEEDAGSVAIDF